MSQAPRWIVKLSLSLFVTMVVLCLGLFVFVRCTTEYRVTEPHGVRTSQVDASEQRVIVRGTVLDAESGEPLADATVTAPDGSETRSDASGRFEFVDLAEELSGPLRAASADGRSAENPLRPLRRGVLEVVLRLRKP
ncbi:MAG: carboxypeptidase regulatory-like domain-containing protein [Planctomycetes bacterium]|nr:carboxypeptidase regulatory-like domain-containing protein [Planctomycetota bacterium]